ncbi:baseplate wedge subunit [Synechococcus phage MA10]|uniref:Baseplate wedge subunit n=2 Tax=root TaxID=1 RepID=A0A6G8R6C2_9CAUD|nr:baseplate wedge subunit [Synechococcus phage S-H34]QIN96925.1 baseplate wedge subunit [Synechococcus phage S-H34]
MAGIQLTEVDFQQIKDNLVDYLKSTGEFTDFDFDGSNLQVILNLIAYQAQLNAYSTNMIANESFLSSATLRNNVVANARMVGYTPTSARSAATDASFTYTLDAADYPNGFPRTLRIDPGQLLMTSNGSESVIFNIIDQQTSAVSGSGVCVFREVRAYEGTFLKAAFTVDDSEYNQKFILENENIDTTTIRVEVQEDPNQTTNEFYQQASNIVTLTPESRAYWLEEVEDGRYELTFGDGLFGRKLQDGAKIFVNYIVTKGEAGNGVSSTTKFSFVGRAVNQNNVQITDRPTVTAVTTSQGGAAIEDVSSIKFRAPRDFASQNRCVVAEDYENIVRRIYPAVDDVYVFGGEELPVPQYGRVYVIIKPSSGYSLSAITKNYIKESLKPFRIASIDVVLADAEIIFIEVVSTVHYDNKRTVKDNSAIVASVKDILTKYSESSTVSKFGGAVRYSRVVGSIDDSDASITRNNTFLRMRRDMVSLIDTSASYEVCFENRLRNNAGTSSVYSTGFQLSIEGVIDPQTYYFEDDSEGNIYRFYLDTSNNKVVVDKNFGTVDYTKGEVLLGYSAPITIVNTTVDNDVIEIRAIPYNQDVIASKTVYADFDIAKSDIVAVVDQEIAGS